MALLLEIYKGKLRQILKKEVEHYKVVSPLLTQDGESAMMNKDNKKTAGSNNNKNKPLQLIDDFIAQNLQFDLHNFLSSHIFFTFSQLGLSELDEVFKKLYNVTRKTTVRVGSSASANSNSASNNADFEEDLQTPFS